MRRRIFSDSVFALARSLVPYYNVMVSIHNTNCVKNQQTCGILAAGVLAVI